MRVLYSSRKPMRKKPVSGFPSAVLSLAGSHAQKSSGVEIGFRLSLFRKKKQGIVAFFHPRMFGDVLFLGNTAT